ncbi:MAG: sodium:proton antiporter, partial [Cyanobacteria bacterium J06632_3]
VAVLPRTETAEADNKSRGELITPRFPIKQWNTFIEDDAVQADTYDFTEDGIDLQKKQVNKLIRDGDMIPLILEQSGKTEVALGETNWQAGTRLTFLLHDPTPQLLKRLSGSRKPSRKIVKPTQEAPEQPDTPIPAKESPRTNPQKPPASPQQPSPSTQPPSSQKNEGTQPVG